MRNYPFVKFTLLFICGIILESYLNLSFPVLLISILFLTICAAISVYSKILSDYSYLKNIFSIAAIIIFGSIVLCNENMSHNFLPVSLQSEQEIKVFGKIKDVELERDYEVRFEIQLDSFHTKINNDGSSIKLICRVRDTKHKLDSLYADIYPGYTIEVTGKFQKAKERRNPGEYDLDASFRNMGLSGYFNTYSTDNISITRKEKNQLSSIVLNFRKYIDRSICHLYSGSAAGLVKGFIVADRSGIDQKINESFINSGVVHVLSVSGLHIAYIVLILLILFSGLGIRTKSLLTILMLLLFAFITGSPAPVLRSIIMAIVIIAAFIFNRNSNIYNSLSIAAFIILIVNPNQLFDPGFQLSFSAALSIALFHPVIKTKILLLNIKYAWINSLLIFISVTFAAQLGTLPFVLMYFHKLSLTAFAANMVIIPLTGLIITNAVASLIIGAIWFKLATLFAASNEFLIFMLYKFLAIAGNPKYSVILIREFTSFHAGLFYIFLFISYFIIKSEYQVKVKIICILLICSSYTLYGGAFNTDLLPAHNLDIVMIDVGQGDAFLVKFPSGKIALIDAGNASSFWDNGEKTILPLLNYLDVPAIDYAFISHVDKDHYSGMVYLLEKNIIKNMYKPEPDSEDVKDVKLESLIRNKRIPIYYYSKSIMPVDNARIYFYNLNNVNKKNTNDNSGVFKIVYGKTGILFTGDLGKMGEDRLAAYWKNALHSDILKISHHGSKNSTKDEFLNLSAPKMCLISVGIRNRYGHPSKEVLDRIKNNSQVLRSDKEGAIFLTSDGENINRIQWR
ncbi:MAG: DNA internalization-related competence protein ComEC/Rec2 [Bacteroidota bacterium]|nr:DNA internalization-related competence protein ComEC/Rec2 [Bacteroidota bacterium]